MARGGARYCAAVELAPRRALRARASRLRRPRARGRMGPEFAYQHPTWDHEILGGFGIRPCVGVAVAPCLARYLHVRQPARFTAGFCAVP